LSPAGELIICGSGAALPTKNNSPTAQVLKVSGIPYLIDAGEGVQERMRIENVKFQKIPAIFISHLHGDHVLGLPGLIGTMNLFGRKQPLQVFGPPGIRAFLDTIHQLSDTHLKFELRIAEIPENKGQIVRILSDSLLHVEAFLVKHRVSTFGFRFSPVHRRRNLLKSAVKTHHLSIAEIKKLTAGKNVVRENGDILHADELCAPKQDPWSYVYGADSRPCQAVVEAAQQVSLLYHEATFCDQDRDLAKKTHHSTASEAGQVALKAQVKHLILGHFSSRYNDLNTLLSEAQTVFPGKISLGVRGSRFKL